MLKTYALFVSFVLWDFVWYFGGGPNGRMSERPDNRCVHREVLKLVPERRGISNLPEGQEMLMHQNCIA